MNHPGKNDIMYRILTHMEAAEQFVDGDRSRIFGVFLVGSQNYELNTETSDIDTKVIIIPSLKDIATNAKPMSIEHHLPNGEHTTITDFRLWMEQVKKQNVHTLEVFFTKYFYINAYYVEIWEQMHELREEIAHYDALRAMHSAVGISFKYYNYIHNSRPTNQATIARFGYDPKSLANLYRIRDFLNGYKANMYFEKCIVPNNVEWLRKVKRGEVFDASAAKDASSELKEELEQFQASLNQMKIDKNEAIGDKFTEWSMEVFNQYLRTVVC